MGSFLGTYVGEGDSLTRVYRKDKRLGQLIMKLRLDEVRVDGSPMLPFRELHYHWDTLERAGLRPFAASIDHDGYLEVSDLSTSDALQLKTARSIRSSTSMLPSSTALANEHRCETCEFSRDLGLYESL